MEIRQIKVKELTEQTGISKSSMSLFLNGKMNLGQDNLEALFEVLGIDLVIKK